MVGTAVSRVSETVSETVMAGLLTIE